MVKQDVKKETAIKNKLERMPSRAIFYEDGIGSAWFVSIVGIVYAVFLTFICVLLFQQNAQTFRFNFPLSDQDRLFEMVPLHESTLRDFEVAQWSTKALSNTFHFSYADKFRFFDNVNQYFTKSGAAIVGNSLTESGIYKAIMDNNNGIAWDLKHAPLVLSSKPVKYPMENGASTDIYTWRVEFCGVIKFINPEIRPTYWWVGMDVIRDSELSSAKGVRINSFEMKQESPKSRNAEDRCTW